MAAVSWPIAEVLGTVTRNPALLFGRLPPELEPGQPASLVVFRHGAPDEFILTRTVVDGVWHVFIFFISTYSCVSEPSWAP